MKTNFWTVTHSILRLAGSRQQLSALFMALLSVNTLHPQCTTVYTDRATNSDYSQLYAWSELNDNYTNPYGGCAPPSWSGWFSHTYTTQVTISTPSGRQATGYGSGYQSPGSPGYSRADTAIEIGGETGSFGLYGFNQIDCSVAGPFYTGYPYDSYNISNWVDAFGISTDGNGNVVLTQGDYNSLVAQGLIPVGAGTVILVNPELYPVVGAGIVLLAVAIVGYQLAKAIKQNYRTVTDSDCGRALVRCLTNPWQTDTGYGSYKDCGSCYSECVNNGNNWPYYKCKP